MNLLLINDTSTSPNQGCQATMFMLNRGLRQYFPEATVQRIFLASINHPFTAEQSRCLLPSETLSPAAAVKAALSSDNVVIVELREAIAAADLVLINGEGSMLEMQRNARVIHLALALAHHFGVACHLLNFTGHLTQPSSIRLAAETFRYCASVAVRDPLSYLHVGRFHRGVKLFPDVVAGLELPPGEVPASGPCVLLGGGSATLRMREPAQLAELTARVQQIAEALAAGGLQVHLMGWYRDQWLQEVTGPGIAYHQVDFGDYFHFCQAAAANFTGRHHGCVMSFAAECPMLTTTANSFKNFGDRLLYGSIGPVLEMENLDVSLAVSLLRDAADLAAQRREELHQRRLAYRPFTFGALENVLRPTPDLVESGVYALPTDSTATRFVQASVP